MATHLKFIGFSESTTTDTPNDLFDVVLPQINNLAELKVVLYVIRRTFGYHKQFDWISLSQFEKGIVDSHGKRLDEGVGLSRKAIVDGLERAVNDRYLEKQFRCPDCNSKTTATRRVQRKPHASKIALPEQCGVCGAKIQRRVQVFYGLAWSKQAQNRG